MVWNMQYENMWQYGMVWSMQYGMVWSMQYGTVWNICMVQYGISVWYSMEYAVREYVAVWYGMEYAVWYGMEYAVWYGMEYAVWYGMEYLYGTVWNMQYENMQCGSIVMYAVWCGIYVRVCMNMQYGMVWYGMEYAVWYIHTCTCTCMVCIEYMYAVWYGMEYGMVWNKVWQGICRWCGYTGQPRLELCTGAFLWGLLVPPFNCFDFSPEAGLRTLRETEGYVHVHVGA